MASTNGHHPQQPPQPSGVVPPPLNEIERETRKLVQENIAGYKELQASGINMDPLSVAHARIDHVMESFAAALGPQGPYWLALVRLQWEQKTAENLRNAKVQGRQQNLAAGGRLSAQEIKSMAKSSGQYGSMFGG